MRDGYLILVYYNDGRVTSYFANYFDYDDKNNWLRKIYGYELNNNFIEVNRGIRY